MGIHSSIKGCQIYLLELSGSTAFLDASFNMRSLQVNWEFIMFEYSLAD